MGKYGNGYRHASQGMNRDQLATILQMAREQKRGIIEAGVKERIVQNPNLTLQCRIKGLADGSPQITQSTRHIKNSLMQGITDKELARLSVILNSYTDAINAALAQHGADVAKANAPFVGIMGQLTKDLNSELAPEEQVKLKHMADEVTKIDNSAQMQLA